MLLASILRPELPGFYEPGLTTYLHSLSKPFQQVSPQLGNFTCEQGPNYISTLGLRCADQAVNQGVLYIGHQI